MARVGEGWGHERELPRTGPSIHDQIKFRSRLRIAAKAFVEHRSEANFLELEAAVKAEDEV